MQFLRLCTCLVIVAAAAQARADEFRVEDASLPIPCLLSPAATGVSGRVDEALEASAIEPIGAGRLLLVAHDKRPELLVVEAATGLRVGRPLTCGRFPGGDETAPKWEGMARDEQGNYYIIGAHSGKDDAERASRSFLFRFRLTGEASGNVAIDEANIVRWQVGDALRQALARETADEKAISQLKIEGMAVRALQAQGGKPARTELVIGLREPADRVRAFAVDITQPPPDGGSLAFKTLFTFDAGSNEGTPAQLTSLEYVPQWEGFLVVTASEDEHNAFHGNTLWFVPDKQVGRGKQLTPQVAYVFEPAMKAEGLCVLPSAQGSSARSVRLAVSYDNDPHATHIPSRLQTLTLIWGER